MNLEFVESTTIADSWFQCVYRILDVGKKYVIDRGSYKGQQRLEFDYITVHIKHPGARPLLPEIPIALGIPNPVDNDYLDQYLPYLMTGELKKGESYTYGQRLTRFPIELSVFPDSYDETMKTIIIDEIDQLKKERIIFFDEEFNKWCLNQIELLIWMYKNKGFGNNQMVLQVANSSDMLLKDPPCLRQIGTKIRNNKLNFIVDFRSWDLWCLSEDSEILTNNGWKNIDNISRIDKAAVYKSSFKAIEFQSITGINKSYYDGLMAEINTKRIDQLLTPNHRILHEYISHSGNKRRIFNWRYTLADNLLPKDGSYIPLAGVYSGGHLSLGADFVWLLGMIISDGSFRGGCDTINIYQSSVNIEYVNKIRNSLHNLNINFNEHVQTRKYSNSNLPSIAEKDGWYDSYCFTILAVDGRKFKQYIPNKKPSNELFNLVLEERKYFLNGLICGDGSFKYGRNETLSYVFYQKDVEVLRWLQTFSFLLGYRTLIDYKKQCLYISLKDKSMLQREHFDGAHLPFKSYKGYVWCVSTPQSNIVMRRNNKISITGNSGFPANLGGIQLLKEYTAGEIGVEDGEMVASSKGMHLYDYTFELAKLRTYKK